VSKKNNLDPIFPAKLSPPMKRPFGLLLATIVLGLLALGQLLMATLMAIVTAAGRHVTPATAAVDVPAAQPFILFFGIGLSLFLAVLAVWAIFTIVGLLRLRNWARISVLIIGGCLAFFGCVSALGMIAGLFFASKFDTHSNVAPPMRSSLLSALLGLSTSIEPQSARSSSVPQTIPLAQRT
jgi:hypothetical protein